VTVIDKAGIENIVYGKPVFGDSLSLMGRIQNADKKERLG
jgi:hypothetical protein